MTVPAGYIVAGEEHGRLVENWDAEVHLTREAGERSLAECHAAGYPHWKLYALTEVIEDDAVEIGVKPDVEVGASA